jgi:hypothetical protein
MFTKAMLRCIKSALKEKTIFMTINNKSKSSGNNIKYCKVSIFFNYFFPGY